MNPLRGSCSHLATWFFVGKARDTALESHFIRTHHTFPSAVTPRVNVAMASSLATHQFAGVQAQFK